MPKRSAGLVMYRKRHSAIEVFLVHPGGPFWAKKDLGAWSIPKGEYLDSEEPLAVARREFQEETSFAAQGEFLELGSLQQAGGKIVSAWAFEGDCDPAELKVMPSPSACFRKSDLQLGILSELRCRPRFFYC